MVVRTSTGNTQMTSIVMLDAMMSVLWNLDLLEPREYAVLAVRFTYMDNNNSLDKYWKNTNG